MNRRSHKIRKHKPIGKVIAEEFNEIEEETFREKLQSESTSDKEMVLVLL